MSKTKPEPTPITEGMATASTVDLVRHLVSFVVAIVLSRLVKYQFLTGDEMSYVYGFLPSLTFNVLFSLWKRYKTRVSVRTALMMPQGSSVGELKAALSSTPPTAVLAADDEGVVVVKEVEKE